MMRSKWLSHAKFCRKKRVNATHICLLHIAVKWAFIRISIIMIMLLGCMKVLLMPITFTSSCRIVHKAVFSIFNIDKIGHSHDSKRKATYDKSWMAWHLSTGIASFTATWKWEMFFTSHLTSRSVMVHFGLRLSHFTIHIEINLIFYFVKCKIRGCFQICRMAGKTENERKHKIQQ